MNKSVGTLAIALLILFLVSMAVSCSEGSANSTDDDGSDEGMRAHSGTGSHYGVRNYRGAESCMICHRSPTEGFATSIHNTWMGETTGKLVGINDFCGAVESNEAMCGKCHGGFGLPKHDFSPEQTDCLICHAPNYKKTATGPDPSVNMKDVLDGIQKVPTREHCLRCHAIAGGGNNNKRGDLELAMGAPEVPRDLDVHMAADMLCQDCHAFDKHHVAGRGMDLRVDDRDKIVSCDDPSCHGVNPHNEEDSMYNMHTEKLYCTACHITAYGKLQSAEVSRDWEHRSFGTNGMYNEKIDRENNPEPIHVWWNRNSDIVDLTDSVTPVNGVVTLAEPVGDLNDGKIYAARLHLGRQPWDGEFLLPFNVKTVKTTNDMVRAIFDATSETHDPVKYVDTQRYMGLFHGVSPKEDALRCNDCHADHKLNFKALGYDVEYDGDENLISATRPGSTGNFATMSGKDCVSCHAIGGFLPEELQIDVAAMNNSAAIHYDLNRGAEDELDPDNVRCWACHGEGDGSEADQPLGHSENYDKAKSCDDGDCHNINQSIFNEPMVSEHFMYADVLDNEGNVLPTENISTGVGCEICHSNSVLPANDLNSELSLVSHYGSTRDLMGYEDFVMTDCTYCHEDHYRGSLNDEIADDWGGAIDMMDDEADMIEDDEDRTMSAGDLWEMRNGYMFEVLNVDLNGDNAHVCLSQNGTKLDDQVIDVDAPYEYDCDVTVDGHTFEQTEVRLNLTGVMRGQESVVAVFEGRTIKRIHRETSNEACYACHMEGYGNNARYTIADRIGDKTYYTKMLVDFEYYGDDESKTLTIGEVWDLGDNWSLSVTQIDVEGDLATIELSSGDEVVEHDVVHTNDVFYYEDDFSAINDTHTFEDLRMFTANVSGIFRSHDEDLITLEDVRLISPEIEVIDVEDTDGLDGFRLDGYNVSRICVGEDFGGGEPFSLHKAPLHNGRATNFADCVHCHDLGSGMDIKRVDAVASHLGAHAGLNENASSDTTLSDPIDKACWACHGSGNEPNVHPDRSPKECADCHVNKVQFGAPDLSQEAHGQIENCLQCHAEDMHDVGTFSPNTPHIRELVARPEIVGTGEIVRISAVAVAGWNMKVEAFEFSLDDQASEGILPIDGVFDEQSEGFAFSIVTDKIGTHEVQVRAMERGQWGPMSVVTFRVEQSAIISEARNMTKPEEHFSLTYLGALIALLHCIGFVVILRRKALKDKGDVS